MCRTWVSGGNFAAACGAEFVQAARALAAAGDEDGGFVRIQPEACGGFLA